MPELDPVNIHYYMYAGEKGLINQRLKSIALVTGELQFLYLERFLGTKSDPSEYGLIHQDVARQERSRPFGAYSINYSIESQENKSGWVLCYDGQRLFINQLQEFFTEWLDNICIGNTPSPLYTFYGDLNTTPYQTGTISLLTKERAYALADRVIDVRLAIAKCLKIPLEEAKSIDIEAFYSQHLGDEKAFALIQEKYSYRPHILSTAKYILNLPKENALRKAFIVKMIQNGFSDAKHK